MAFHFCADKEAFTPSSSSIFQNPGHKGRPLGMIAGNSITSHWSAFRVFWALSKRAVRSFVPQRVITMTIAPPGCSLVRGPELYHSQAFSKASSLIASCSECGSSMIKTSAPRPVIAPPTPTAKYSPPLFVSHRPAAFESCFKVTSGNTSLYMSMSIKSRTFRPNRTANSLLCVASIALVRGSLPIR